MTRLLDAAPTASSNAETDAAARGWLAELGVGVQSHDGPPCTVLAVMVDEDGEIAVFAIPDSKLDAAAHAELAAVSGAAFEWHFNGDLSPEQFAGAFRICGGISTEVDVFEEQIEELCAEMDDEAPDMDWDALKAQAGAWNDYRVAAGARLGPLTHVYTARLCM